MVWAVSGRTVKRLSTEESPAEYNEIMTELICSDSPAWLYGNYSTYKRQLATEGTEKHREQQDKYVFSISPCGNQVGCCILLFLL